MTLLDTCRGQTRGLRGRLMRAAILRKMMQLRCRLSERNASRPGRCQPKVQP